MAEDNGAASEIAGLKNRIRELGKQKSELVSELRQVKAELGEAQTKASTADTLATQLDKANADLASARQSAEWTDAMLDAGVTDSSGRDYLSYQYGKLGDDRPEFSKWLEGRRENAKGFEAQLFGAPDPAASNEPPSPEPPAPASEQRRGATTGGAHNGTSQGLTWQQILDPNTPTDQALGGNPAAMPWTTPYGS